MKRILFIMFFIPSILLAQWGEIPFYKDAKFIKNGKIRAIQHQSFLSDGIGEVVHVEFEAAYLFHKNGSLDKAYTLYLNNTSDSVHYEYSKGKLTKEKHYSNRASILPYYEVIYSYDKKGLLEEKRDHYTKTSTSYYYDKNILTQEVSTVDDSPIVYRIIYSKDGELDKKTTITERGNGKRTEEIELSSRDNQGNLTQELYTNGTEINDAFFYKNYYSENQLDGFSQFKKDMQTVNFTVAYRYNEKNWITYESLKYHKSPPNNDQFGSVKASTFEYYLW